MNPDERDAFLGTGGTGVISFATTGDEPPHSIPVSYGYDGSEVTFYFRLAVDAEATKGMLPTVPFRSLRTDERTTGGGASSAVDG